MPCNHKFIQYLNLDKIDFEPETLIIGTFNPEWLDDNYAEWFYGRTRNNYFWDVLPRMFGEKSLRRSDVETWKQFCSEYKIGITDLITSINDADRDNPEHFEMISNYHDNAIAEHFEDFQITNIKELLENYPTIKKVFFTRNQGIDLFDNPLNHTIKFCEKNEIYFSHLLTPSASARFQMRGWEPRKPNFERTLSNFIYESWLDNWEYENV